MESAFHLTLLISLFSQPCGGELSLFLRLPINSRTAPPQSGGAYFVKTRLRVFLDSLGVQIKLAFSTNCSVSIIFFFDNNFNAEIVQFFCTVWKFFR